MIRLTPRATRTDTHFPDTSLFRSRVLIIRIRKHVGAKGDGGLGALRSRLRRDFPHKLPGRGDRELAHRTAPGCPKTSRSNRAVLHPHPDSLFGASANHTPPPLARSEERRVGKECVSTVSLRGAAYH